MSTPLLAEFEALVDREWDRMANAGTWWTGTERVAIATEARIGHDDAPSTNHLSTVAIEAARRVSAEAATIRQVDIDRWADGGLDPFAYVELIGVVSRLAAIDVTAFGLGMDERPLPVPQPGNPSLERPTDAVVSNGWVPTVGPAWAPGALSAVPDEVDAMFDIHGVLYLSMEQMRNNEIVRNGIHRAQIELTAARTSWLNECFYWLLAHTSMLRASIETIEDGELICPTITSGLGNCGVAKGDVIRAFADSVALRDDDEYPDCRVRAEFALGRDGADRIAMVAGNFSMMNRALDAIGAPIDSAMDSLAAEMGTSIPAHLRRPRSTTVRDS